MPYTNIEDKRKWAREYNKKYRKENPRKILSARLKRQYNMTLEQYDKILEEQENGCAICGSEVTETPYFIDHDHKCCPGAKSCGECVRGLLCMMCNSALGMLKDDPEIIASALKYIVRRK